MTYTRIAAADLLRLVAIASASPEGAPEEVVAILQRTEPATVEAATGSDVDLSPGAEPDKLAKPE